MTTFENEAELAKCLFGHLRVGANESACKDHNELTQDALDEAVSNAIDYAYERSEDGWEPYGGDWTEVLESIDNEILYSFIPTIYEVTQDGYLKIAHILITQAPYFAKDYVHFEGLKPPKTYDELFEPIHEKLCTAACSFAEDIWQYANDDPLNVTPSTSTYCGPYGETRAYVDYSEDNKHAMEDFDGNILQFNGIELEERIID